MCYTCLFHCGSLIWERIVYVHCHSAFINSCDNITRLHIHKKHSFLQAFTNSCDHITQLHIHNMHWFLSNLLHDFKFTLLLSYYMTDSLLFLSFYTTSHWHFSFPIACLHTHMTWFLPCVSNACLNVLWFLLHRCSRRRTPVPRLSWWDHKCKSP